MIIHTQFLEELCEDLNMTAYNVGLKSAPFTVESLADTCMVKFADQILDVYKTTLCTTLRNLDKYDIGDPADAYELKQCIESLERTRTDLYILSDLHLAEYAAPERIGNSIKTLSVALTCQLDHKVHNQLCYNEYYCKQIAEVLAELCTLIKEV